MTTEVERFLATATEPLKERPEARDEARTELMSRLSHQGVPLELLQLEEPTERLENAARPSPWLRRSLLLVALVALLAGVGTGAGAMIRDLVYQNQVRMLGYRHLYTLDHGNELGVQRWARTVAPGLPLLSGSPEEAAAALAQNPDDVAMFQQRLLLQERREGNGWPGLSDPDWEMAGRLDPANGFYPYLQMDVHFSRALAAAPTRSGSYVPPSATGPTVHDEGEFATALRFFEQAANAERFSDDSGRIGRRQVDAFPPEPEYLQDELRTRFADVPASSGEATRIAYGSNSWTVVGVQAKRLETSGDIDALLELRELWWKMSRNLVEGLPDGGVEYYSVRNWIIFSGRPIQQALEKLGRLREAGELEEVINAVDAVRVQFDTRLAGAESPSVRVSRWREVPSDLDPAELVPAGRVEWAVLDRGLAFAGAIVALWLVGFTAFEAYRRRRPVKLLAKGLMPLFRPVDHGWILGLGLVLPWLAFWSVTRLTPLGLQDLSFDYKDGVPVIVAMIQYSGGVVFAAAMVLRVAYWRWEKRGGFLGFHGGAMFLGWIGAALAGLGIPAAGLVRLLGFTSDEDRIFYLLGVGGMVAMGLLWLIWIGVLNLCTPQANALRANVVSRTVLAWYLVGGLSLLVGAECLRQVERHWMGRDQLLPTWTSGTHKNALEERLARDLHDRLLPLVAE